MGKFFKLFCMLAVCFSVSVSAAPANPEPMSGKTALQFFADNKIGAGWNLGNTLDAYNNGVATEGVWSWGTGAPPATQALFTGVKASGFDIVRIPVTWVGHIGGAPNYTISQERLRRVDEVIGYAKNAGIKAIIINVHHDGFAGGTGTLGFVDLKGSINNTQKKAQVQDQLGKVWTQIANHFKNYGDYLIFETLNEVHDGNWGGVQNTQAYRDQQDILFDWNQAALNAIRATGGNNAARFVAVPALGSTEPSYVINAHSRGKLLPNDGAANGRNKLIVSVHYYHPWRYTVADVTSQTPGETLLHTLTDDERKHPASAMGDLKSTFINNGIAVYVGEWGGPNYTRANMSAEIKATHIGYISNVASKITENSIVPIYWDDNGNFRMLSRTNGQPQAGFYTEVHTAMMSAIKNSTAISPTRTAASVKKPGLAQRGKVINSTAPIYLYTLNGKLMAASHRSESLATLNLSHVPNGVYIAKSGNATLRVRLQR